MKGAFMQHMFIQGNIYTRRHTNTRASVHTLYMYMYMYSTQLGTNKRHNLHCKLT